MIGNCCLYEQLARPDPMSFLRILDALMMMRRRRTNFITTKRCLVKSSAATENIITWDTCFIFFPARPNNFSPTQTCTKNKKTPNRSTDQKMFSNLHSTYLMTYFFKQIQSIGSPLICREPNPFAMIKIVQDMFLRLCVYCSIQRMGWLLLTQWRQGHFATSSVT